MAGSHKFEYKVRIGSTDYGEAYIQGTPLIEKVLMKEPCFGRCCTSVLTITLRDIPSASIPKAAAIKPFCRIYNAGVYSDWVSLGSFWVSQREDLTELITLTCHNRMLYAGREYLPLTQYTEWPVQMATVVSEICTLLGCSLDSRTTISTDTGYQVSRPNEDTLISEVLGWIAAAHGGIFIITDDDELRLVKFPDTGAPVFALGGAYNEYVSYSAAAVQISRMTLLDSAGNEFSAGDDTGGEILANCEYATQHIADELEGLSGLAGGTSVPYSLSVARIDPLLELGDTFSITRGGQTVGLIASSIVLYLDMYLTATVANGVEEDNEDEVPYLSPSNLEAKRVIRSDKVYYGNKINRSDGFVSELMINDEPAARMIANADRFVLQRYNAGTGWTNSVYFDAVTRKYVFTGDVTVEGMITSTDLATAGSTVINGSNITTGTINTQQVLIQGNANFKWDGNYILVQDPSDALKQIRVGKYDGANYGIGYTTDGGTTWQNAIGFDGVTLQSGSITSGKLSQDLQTSIASIPTMANAIADLQIDLNGKSTVYYSATTPTDPVAGDIWYDISAHTIKRYTVTQDVGSWVDITSEALYAALTAAGTAQATADGKIVTYMAAYPPAGVTFSVGDIFIDTDNSNRMYRWSGSTWVDARDTTYDQTITDVALRTTDNAIIATVTGSTTYKYGLNAYRNFALNSDAETTWVDGTLTDGRNYRYVSDDLFEASNHGARLLFSFEIKRTNVVAGSDNRYFGGFIAYTKSDGTRVGEGRYMYSTDDDFASTDSDWVRIERQCDDISVLEPVNFQYFYWTVLSNATGTIQVRNLKVEVSDDFSDWCPAIEDLAALATRVTTAEQKITDSAIISTVRSSTLYQYDLYNARNFALASDTIGQLSAAGLITKEISDELFEASAHGTRLRVSFDILRVNIVPNSNGQYFEARIDYTNAEGSYGWGSYLTSSDTDYASTDVDWVRIKRTFNMSSMTPLQFNYFFWRYPSGVTGSVYVKNLKIEVSDDFTEWCPAVEDVSDLQTRMSVAELKITDSAIMATVEEQGGVFRDGTTGKLRSIISQTAQDITISAEQIQIGDFTYGNADANGALPGSLYTGGKINVSGVTTSTGLCASHADWAFWAGSGVFRVAQNGALFASNAAIRGTLTAGNWTFDSYGSTFSQTVGGTTYKGHMAILTGGQNAEGAGAAKDPTDIRVYYMTENCDAMYGGDYSHSNNIFFRGKRFIYMTGTNDEEMAIMGKFKDSSEGTGTEFSFFPVEDNRGNVGSSKRRWYTLRYGDGGCSGSSSRTKKENIVPIDDCGDLIDRLEPVTFDFKKRHTHSCGFILEDVYEFMPIVCDVEDGDLPDGGIFYERFIPYLVRELQSLRRRVKELEEAS